MMIDVKVSIFYYSRWLLLGILALTTPTYGGYVGVLLLHFLCLILWLPHWCSILVVRGFVLLVDD